MIDRAKVLDAAQKFLAKGQLDKAIAEYQKIVRADPNDVRTWLKIGDIYTRKGAHKEACEPYALVAEHYAQQGFFLKAVAVYKQILKLQPHRTDISVKLGEMYEALQHVSDALATYEQASISYARDGRLDQSIAMLERMVALDPNNIPVRIKWAEALSKAERTSEAADAFATGATLLREQGRIDDYIKVAERLLYHRPEDATARELALLYIQRGDAKRALSKLQTCFKQNPRDPETLELLAKAFHILGQINKTISVYRELVRILQELGRSEDRIRIYRAILELEPDDIEAKDAIATYEAELAEAAVASEPSAMFPEAELIEVDEGSIRVEIGDDGSVITDLSGADLQPLTVPPAATDETSAVLFVEDSVPPPPGIVEEESPGAVQPSVPPMSPDVVRDAQVARLLSECDVYTRYGLRSKVLDTLQKIVDLDPSLVEIRERLKDAYIERGLAEQAASQLRSLAKLVPESALFYLQQAVQIAPSNAEARAELDAIVDASGPATDPPMRADTADADQGGIVFVDELDEDDLIPDDSIPSPAPFPSAPAAARGAHPTDIEDLLEEADFFAAQGMIQEAQAILHDAQGSFGQHPLLLDKLQELAEMESAAPVHLALDEPATGADNTFELAARLAAEGEGVGAAGASDNTQDIVDVEEIFAQFKRGIAATVSAQDTDTHYDLGIAYREMGLHSDAIQEFLLAAQNPERECIARMMIGLCHRDQGDLKAASVAFEAALQSPGRTEREELGLRYELGFTYETLGDSIQALECYKEVARLDPVFRDVTARLSALEAKTAAARAANTEMSDLDSAFDDLLGSNPLK